MAILFNTKKLSQIDPSPGDADSDVTIVAVRDNGDGTYTDLRYTTAQIAGVLAGELSKPITVSTPGTTIADSYFSLPVRAIAIGGQTYPISAATFTQDTGSGTITITTGGSVAAGDIIIAYR